MLQGELPLARVAGICFAEHGVAVPGNDLSGLKEAPNVFLDLVVRGTKANVLSNLSEKKQYCDNMFNESICQSDRTFSSPYSRTRAPPGSRGHEVVQPTLNKLCIIWMYLRNMINIIKFRILYFMIDIHTYHTFHRQSSGTDLTKRIQPSGWREQTHCRPRGH